jgi:hypothetical protein
VLEGDVLRATSAAAMRMTYPTAQLMFGGGPRAAQAARLALARRPARGRVQPGFAGLARGTERGCAAGDAPPPKSRTLSAARLPGVGRPKLMRALVPVSGGFAAAMDAVRSNRQLGDEITLFLERPAEAGGGGGADAGSGGEAAGASPGGGEAVGGVFDPSLFDS